jgi:hypothetical protein
LVLRGPETGEEEKELALKLRRSVVEFGLRELEEEVVERGEPEERR